MSSPTAKEIEDYFTDLDTEIERMFRNVQTLIEFKETLFLAIATENDALYTMAKNSREDALDGLENLMHHKILQQERVPVVDKKELEPQEGGSRRKKSKKGKKKVSRR